MSEIGYQLQLQVPGWASLIEETHETNPDLMWPASIDVTDRMRTEDAQVGSVLRAVTLPILRTTWSIDPAGARDEVAEHVADNLSLPLKGQAEVAPLRTQGRFAWIDHLRLALLSLPFGHSYFEQVYRYEGGRVHLAKLAWRPPRTIADIEVARDGGLVAIIQHGSDGRGRIRIPVDRLVAYVPEREGGNWVGRSLLRTAYKNWLLKDRLLRVQALTAERNGLGIPVYTGAPAPQDLPADDVEKWHQKQIEAGLAIAQQVRAGETAGVSMPSGGNLAFVGVTGKLPDTEGPIRYHDEQIGRSVLANFLNLGGDKSTGSYALGDTFEDFFTSSLNAVAEQFAAVVQQHVIEDLVDLNWGVQERAPRIVPSVIGAEHPATADAIKTLIDCGALPITPELTEFVRARYGLPVGQTPAEPAASEGAQ